MVMNTEQEALATLERLMVGVTRKSTANCDWYDGIKYDALAEARDLIARTSGKGN